MYGAKAVRPLAVLLVGLSSVGVFAQARGAAPPGRAGGPPPYAPGRRVDRSDRPMGVARHGRLALPDVHRPQGRHRVAAAQPGRPEGRGRLGSGQGRNRRRAVQGVWRGRHHAAADAAARDVAGRHHAEDRNRHGHADAAAAIRDRGRASLAAGRARRWRRGSTRARQSRRAGSARGLAPARRPEAR